MSFFNKMIFKTFLFFSLMFFSLSSVYAKTLTYYSNANFSQCGLQSAPICSDYASSINGNGRTYSVLSCYQTGGFLAVSLKETYVYQKSDGSTATEISTTSGNAGFVMTKECGANDQIVLDGCTATCVADPCAVKKGQRENISTQCGTLTCSKGVTSLVGSAFVCSEGVGSFSPSSPSGNAVKDSCAMVGITSESPPTLSEARAKTQDIGGSSVPMYCNYEYEYTGESGGQDSPTNAASLTFTGGATKMPADGICKDPTPLKGKLNGVDVCYPNTLPDSPCPVAGEVPNSNGVCVGPNDPTYPDPTKPTDPNKDPNQDNPNTCPKGQIKNISGVCVPYGDATECPTGQSRNNMGLCSPTPQPNNCPQGQTKNAQGVCANDPRGTGCADGSLPNALGVCANGAAACGIGQTRNAQGVCVSASSGSGCKDGTTPNAQGFCGDGSASCPVGKVRNAQGQCVVDTTDPSQKTSASLPTDCTNAPACDGDPILCAVYNQQWKNNCDAFRAPNENEKAQVMGAISDTNSQIEASENEYKNAVESIISGSGLLNNQVPTTTQCIADKQVTIINGLSVNVPFSVLCPYFSLLRSMLILVAYLFAARIVYAELTGGGIRV